MHRRLEALGIAALLVLGACFGIGSEDLAEIEPEAAPLEPDYDLDIAPLMDRFCITCHSADAGIKSAEPPLDTEVEVEAASCRSRVRAVQEQSMPPGAMQRFSGVDRLTFDRWVVILWGGQVPECPEPIEN